MNYFDIFGLQESFALDQNELAQAYRRLQKAVHPDRFAHASSQEQQLAVQKSTLINDAYQTLKDPLKRGDYLLSLRQVDKPSEQASFSESHFLMHQMELHEMIAELKHSDDIDGAFANASQVLDSEAEQLFVLLQQQLLENSKASNQQACETIRKLKFYQKLELELERLEESLLD